MVPVGHAVVLPSATSSSIVPLTWEKHQGISPPPPVREGMYMYEKKRTCVRVSMLRVSGHIEKGI